MQKGDPKAALSSNPVREMDYIMSMPPVQRA